ncbi:large ribosomal subunit protein uL15m isoform X3 [Oryctolagus cuniculus]|uniref:large ribosomal subunit protein uL15m isoform X3 n=1 Tax=Oryctolagus cuniculus TaxID=9986 RepID=UPI00387A0061
MQTIDLSMLISGGGVTIQPHKRDYGVQQIEETLDIMQGANNLKAKVNIEVQMASELAIAAIEKNGGVVTTAFYDPRSLEIPCIPVPFFLCGQPIPKQMLTRTALVPYYTDAKNHGYPADRAKFPEARLELTRKTKSMDKEECTKKFLEGKKKKSRESKSERNISQEHLAGN